MLTWALSQVRALSTWLCLAGSEPGHGQERGGEFWVPQGGGGLGCTSVSRAACVVIRTAEPPYLVLLTETGLLPRRETVKEGRGQQGLDENPHSARDCMPDPSFLVCKPARTAPACQGAVRIQRDNVG